MTMAYMYETIIIGATHEGLTLAEMLASPDRKIAVISSNFIYKTSSHKLENVQLVQATGIFLSYNHGLFDLSTMTGSLKGHFCSPRLVLATGTKPIKTSLKNLNICYKPEDIVGKHKTKPAIVYGTTEEAAKYALDLSNRFGYLYFCTQGLELPCSKKLQKKVNETANIVHLPSCIVTGCKNNKEGQLSEVTLDAYATIKSSALVFALGRIPDFPNFTRKFIGQTSEGFADVTSQNESKLVPKFYAIGKLCAKTTKKDLNRLAVLIKSDIGGLENA